MRRASDAKIDTPRRRIEPYVDRPAALASFSATRYLTIFFTSDAGSGRSTEK